MEWSSVINEQFIIRALQKTIRDDIVELSSLLLGHTNSSSLTTYKKEREILNNIKKERNEIYREEGRRDTNEKNIIS